MQSGKAQVQEIGGHAAKDKKKQNPNFHPVNNHPNKLRSVHTKFYNCDWLIQSIIYQWRTIISGTGLLTSSPDKGELIRDVGLTWESPDLVKANRRQFIRRIWHLFCTKSSLPSSFSIIVIAHLSLCRVDILDRLETPKNLHRGCVTHC